MDCIFCKIINGEIPSKRVYEDDKVIAILDVNPVVDGHTLVIPKKHIKDYKEIDEELLLHLYKVAQLLADKLQKKLGAKAITFSVNYGDSQVVKHFHLHLLPDYSIKEKSLTVDEVYELVK